MSVYRSTPRRLLLSGALIVAVGATGVASSSSMPAVREMPLSIAQRHDPVKVKKRREDGLFESTNWSGYAVTGPNGSVTVASGTWVVPKATCTTTSAQYSSFWVGIDGYSSNTVEQTGTDSDCSGKTPQYYAWYEFYPKGSFLISSTKIGSIGPGTVMSATITFNVSAQTYTVTLVNNSQNNRSFSITQKVGGATSSSAEWIAEAPSSSGGVLAIANFGKVNFTNSTATVGGVTGTIGSFIEDGCTTVACSKVVQELTMVQSNGAGAQPSDLDSTGGAFSDSYVGPTVTPPPGKKHGKG